MRFKNPISTAHNGVGVYNDLVQHHPQVRKHSWFVLIALAVNTGIVISYIGLWIIAAQEKLLWRADFTVFYTGGELVSRGLGNQLYDWDLQAIVQQEILEGRSFSDGVLPFNYPPYVALVSAPLTAIPIQQAYNIWAIIQLLLLLVLVSLLWKFSSHWQPIERWLMLSTCLAIPGLLRNFLLGALSLWIWICIFSWYMAARNENDRKNGLWLFLSSVKPQLAVGPALITLAGRRWKALIVVVISAFLLFIVTSWILGWNIWRDFLSNIIASGSHYDQYGISPSMMYNLKGTLTLWLGSIHAKSINLISIAGFVFSIVLTILLWRGKWDVHQPTFSLRLAFTLLIAIFFSLHVNLQDGLLLTIPGLLFYDYLRQSGASNRIYVGLLLSCPTAFLLDEFYLSKYLPVHLAVVAMVVMMVWTGFYLLKNSRSVTSENI